MTILICNKCDKPISNIFYEYIFCQCCRERLNPEDIRKNEDAIIRKIFEENPSYYDSNGDLPLVLDKNGRQLSHQEIMNICDSPNTANK